MLLSLKNITVHYGTAQAVKDITLGVEEGAIVSIIGANGAGKSTILKAISGLIPLTSGEIWFQDKKISGMATHDIVKLGLVQVPEGRQLFPYMSVLANLKLGAYLRKDKEGVNKDLDDIFKRFPVLQERRKQKAGTLSGGEQQMLAICRALMAKPKLLMMDEPSIGLAPLIIEQLGEVIRAINESGISILLLEQNAGLVTSVSEKCYVVEVGKVVLEGDLKELLDNDLVRRAFLGV
ncbi:MAG: ABC transporter ATP-binding protein [Dehalococcoidia bacterium]|jgi:branched-chain amino acid transport system ATP-binding protein